MRVFGVVCIQFLFLVYFLSHHLCKCKLSRTFIAALIVAPKSCEYFFWHPQDSKP